MIGLILGGVVIAVFLPLGILADRRTHRLDQERGDDD